MRKIDFDEPVQRKSRIEVEKFERAFSAYLGVRYCVGVHSGTTGLMLVIKALGISKEVIVPSFTFSGTVHALSWNGIIPRFVDIDRRSFNLDIHEIQKNITADTTALLAVHLFGNPCEISALEKLARKNRLKLIFDSAHAFGCQYAGRKLGGFGDAEVFSLQSSKILSASEGGVITTNNQALYQKLVLMRGQGNRGDGDCIYVGMNARMHPSAARLGLSRLRHFSKSLIRRQRFGKRYLSLLSQIPGIQLQAINPRAVCNYQYIPIVIDRKIFGMSRDQLAKVLERDGIATRRYFHPPVHRFNCYRYLRTCTSLEDTEYISSRILCLPFYASMKSHTINSICSTICALQSAQ